MKRVQDAFNNLKNPSTEMISSSYSRFGFFSFTSSELLCFCERNWLTDDSISFIFHLMQVIADEQKMKIVFLRPEYISLLFGSSNHVDHYGILKVFSKISEMKRFIFPISVNNNHWILIDVEIDVENTKKEIIFYDPLHGDIQQEFTETIQAFFDVHFPELLGQAWNIQNCKDIEIQKDGFNCGVFVILYAYGRMVRCRQPEWFSDLNKIRMKLISAAIKHGKKCDPPFSTDDEVILVPSTFSIYPVAYFS